ncbi:MAG: MaoC family dehydratase [Myxococcales bacterium]|nr:MaoC family dehydratase [Myxococcales bacterium]
MPRWYFEDFTPGMTFEAKGPTLTREAIIDFARQFDPQPFHLDEEAGKKSLFGALAASGWHTAALAMRMMVDGWLNDTASLGSPGVDELRWVRPVLAGDTLSMKATVLAVKPSKSKPFLGAVQVKCEVFNQRAEPVMLVTNWGLIKKRGA